MDTNQISLLLRKDPLFLSKLTFGQRLTYYRECKHLSKSELAKRIHRHHTLIGKYESGEKKPSLEALFSLSKELACDPLDLLYGLPFFFIDQDNGLYSVFYCQNLFDKKGNLKETYHKKNTEQYKKFSDLLKTGSAEEIDSIINKFIKDNDYNSLIALSSFARALEKRKDSKTKKVLEQLANEILNKTV